MREKILFVDDEVLILESLRREFGFQYNLDTASSGQEGLEKLASQGAFAVVVADYRMPRMDGVQFLIEVMKRHPDTVRIMLTGNADLQTAVEAVNQGQIFRFLTKPCSPELLTRALEAGLRQYQLVTAEKELLENTLVESINMLTEVLSIVNPKAYGKSLRIRQLVLHIVCYLNLENPWQYEMAAALSQLGWIIFPPELLNKIAAGKPLSASESMLFGKHPFTAKKLLENIPRLEVITQMIEGQERSIEDLCLDKELCKERYVVDMGSHLLKVCVDYDQLITQGLYHTEALAVLYRNKAKYRIDVLDALSKLRSYQPERGSVQVDYVHLDELEAGMIIVDPVKDRKGNILIEPNTPVSRSVLVSLYSQSGRPGFIVEPIKVIYQRSLGSALVS